MVVEASKGHKTHGGKLDTQRITAAAANARIALAEDKPVRMLEEMRDLFQIVFSDVLSVLDEDEVESYISLTDDDMPKISDAEEGWCLLDDSLSSLQEATNKVQDLDEVSQHLEIDYLVENTRCILAGAIGLDDRVRNIAILMHQRDSINSLLEFAENSDEF